MFASRPRKRVWDVCSEVTAEKPEVWLCVRSPGGWQGHVGADLLQRPRCLRPGSGQPPTPPSGPRWLTAVSSPRFTSRVLTLGRSERVLGCHIGASQGLLTGAHGLDAGQGQG